jgi:Putative 2OG-Fe(II) oxygenase
MSGEISNDLGPVDPSLPFRLTPLFSVPLYSTVIDLDSAPPLESVDMETLPLLTISRDRDLLMQPDWLPMQALIQQHVENYFYGVMCAHPRLHVEIAGSWLNNYRQGTQQFRHYHANSEFSGCLFFNQSENPLNLYTLFHQASTWARSKDNIWNSQFFRIRPEPGLLVIWPSIVYHDTLVEKTGDRWSLAFDVSVKGRRYEGDERHNY